MRRSSVFALTLALVVGAAHALAQEFEADES